MQRYLKPFPTAFYGQHSRSATRPATSAPPPRVASAHWHNCLVQLKIEGMPRACWGSQSMSGRSQRRSSRWTLQFRRPKHPGASSDGSMPNVSVTSRCDVVNTAPTGTGTGSTKWSLPNTSVNCSSAIRARSAAFASTPPRSIAASSSCHQRGLGCGRLDELVEAEEVRGVVLGLQRAQSLQAGPVRFLQTLALLAEVVDVGGALGEGTHRLLALPAHAVPDSTSAWSSVSSIAMQL